MNTSVRPVTTDQLLADFKLVVSDAEALLLATASHGGEEVAKVRAKAQESLERVKERLADEQSALVAKTKDAAKSADLFVHENPWAAIGVAAGVGFMIGLLNGRG